MERKKSALGIAFALTAGVCWGFSGMIGQLLYQKGALNGPGLSALRMPAAGLIILLWALVTKGRAILDPWRNRRDRIQLIIYSFCGMLPCQVGYLVAIQYSDVGTATVLAYTAPVIILLVFCVMNHRLPRVSEAIATVLAVTGVYLVATHGQSTLSISPLGLFWGMMAALGTACNSLLPQRLLSRYPSLVITGWAMVIATVGTTALAAVLGAEYHLVPFDFLYLAAIILIGTVLPFWSFLTAVRLIGPVRTGLIASVELVAALVFSVLCMHQHFAPMDFVGFAAIGTAVVLMNRNT